MSFPATDCARARESISAQLDGELPELELDRLETHLRICPACTVWADEVWALTLQLREAPLEQPAHRFALLRLRRGWRVSSAVAVASAAAVVATMFVAPGQRESLSSQSQVPQVSRVATQHLVVSSLTPLEDGMFYPVSVVSASGVNFRHV